MMVLCAPVCRYWGGNGWHNSGDGGWWASHQDAESWKGWQGYGQGWQGWPQGGDGETPDATMMEVEVEKDEVDEEELSLMSHAMEKYWKVEQEARLVNASLTSYEQHQLSSVEIFNGSKADVAKVLNLFGNQKGATRAVKALMELVDKKWQYQPGETCHLQSPEFSLCKHFLVCHNKSTWPDECGDKQPLEKLKDTTIKCYCFPATSMMLKGCLHHKECLFNKNMMYPDTFCVTCSRCFRCKG